jgi:hypothetical protein
MSAYSGKYVDSMDSGKISVAQTGVGEDSFLMSVGTGAAEQVDLSRLTNPGICVLRNLCPSGYGIEAGPSGNLFIEIPQYMAVPLPLKDAATVFVQSVGSGDALLEVKVYEK